MTSANFPEALGLGTLLRHLIELLDGGIERVYRERGLDCRSRFTPVLRHIQVVGPSAIKALAKANNVSHSAASQTASEMMKRGLLNSEPGPEDSRERILSLSATGQMLLAKVQPIWRAIGEAEGELMASTPGSSLRAVLESLIASLEEVTYEARILARLEGTS